MLSATISICCADCIWTGTATAGAAKPKSPFPKGIVGWVVGAATRIQIARVVSFIARVVKSGDWEGGPVQMKATQNERTCLLRAAMQARGQIEQRALCKSSSTQGT